jgi:RNA polymerase sigma-70 factor, ECF subfamily
LITPDISVVGVGAFDSATGSTAPTVDDLFRLYERRIRGLARRRLGDNALADDVVQETFVRAHKAWAGFDSRRDAWPWLAQIARNLCVDVVRQSASSSAQCASAWRECGDEADATADPAEQYGLLELRAGVNRVLGSLTPKHRRVLVLKDAEGWSVEDVARLEGLTTEACKSVIRRARQSFRRCYVDTDAAGKAPAFLPVLVFRNALRRIGRRITSVWQAAGAPAIEVLGGIGSAAFAVGAAVLTIVLPFTNATTGLATRDLRGASAQPAVATASAATPAAAQPSDTQAPANVSPSSRGMNVAVNTPAGVTVSGGAKHGQSGDYLDARLLAAVPGGTYGDGPASVKFDCNYSTPRRQACDVVEGLLPAP